MSNDGLEAAATMSLDRPDTWAMDNRSWLEGYLSELMGMMGLDSWRVHIEDGWPSDVEPSARACIWRSADYHEAFLACHEPRGDIQLRDTLVHELLHLMLREVDEAFDDLAPHFGEQAWSVAKGRYRHAMEQSIDAIAVAWSPMMPMPPKRKG